MPTTRSFALALAVLFAAPAAAQSLTVMPLGDSRVDGGGANHDSYRYDLWGELRADAWDFDFVGPEFDTNVYPGSDQLEMDREHYGIGGMTAYRLRQELPGTLPSFAAPDVTLLGLGGNDLKHPSGRPVAAIVDDMVAIIDMLQAANPDMTIFVELIAPARSDVMTPDLAGRLGAFTAAIAMLPAQQSTATSEVITIDMQTGWIDAYMADPVHYNAAGAAEVARRYRDALTAEFGLGGTDSVGASYCAAVPNSTGGPAELRGAGSASIAENDFTLVATGVTPERPVVFITSRSQGFFPGLNGTTNGNLCLSGQIDRFVGPGQIDFTDTAGAISLSIDLMNVPDGASASAVLAGETRSFQGWYRDWIGLGSNFTEGLEVTFTD